MADYNSSLPIRTQANGDAAVKVVDGTITSQVLGVNSDGEAKVEVHGDNPTGGDEVLRLSELGAVNSDGVYDGTNNTKPAHVGLVASTRAAAPADSDQTKRLTAVVGGDDTVCLDVAIRDESGVAWSESNPLPVYETEAPGTEVVNYDTSSAIAAAATDNHNYTVTALKTLIVERIMVAASGKCKAVVQVETGVGAGTFTDYAVMFNSTANPNMVFEFSKRLKVAAGVIIRIARTNNDNQAQDLYSTIIGVEV